MASKDRRTRSACSGVMAFWTGRNHGDVVVRRHAEVQASVAPVASFVTGFLRTLAAFARSNSTSGAVGARFDGAQLETKIVWIRRSRR